jgi:hypothetical protein
MNLIIGHANFYSLGVKRKNLTSGPGVEPTALHGSVGALYGPSGIVCCSRQLFQNTETLKSLMFHPT